MRSWKLTVAGTIAALLIAVVFSSCHARLLAFFAMFDTEAVSGTTTEHLARDYRAVRVYVPVWCPAAGNGPGAGAVAAEVDAFVDAKLPKVCGPVAVLRPGWDDWKWLAPFAAWLLTVHIAGVFAAGMHAGWQARRTLRRRGNSTADPRVVVAPAVVGAVIMYVIVAPLAGMIVWFVAVDPWWPTVLEARQAFPSLLGAPASAAICLAPSLVAGYTIVRMAVWRRAPRDPALSARLCKECGYDRGSAAIARCPECGRLPSRWRLLRRSALFLVSGPSRLAFYCVLIGGIVAWMHVWAYGWPDLSRFATRPKASILLHPRQVDARIHWRQGDEPTLIRWADGTLLFDDRITDDGSAGPFAVSYAAAWLPRGFDGREPANWQFEAGEAEFPGSYRGGAVSVHLDEGGRLCAGPYGRVEGARMANMRLLRELVVSTGDVFPAYALRCPLEIEKVGEDHPLAGLLDRLRQR